jgi:hypothetical protein
MRGRQNRAAEVPRWGLGLLGSDKSGMSIISHERAPFYALWHSSQLAPQRMGKTSNHRIVRNAVSPLTAQQRVQKNNANPEQRSIRIVFA